MILIIYYIILYYTKHIPVNPLTGVETNTDLAIRQASVQASLCVCVRACVRARARGRGRGRARLPINVDPWTRRRHVNYDKQPSSRG